MRIYEINFYTCEGDCEEFFSSRKEVFNRKSELEKSFKINKENGIEEDEYISHIDTITIVKRPLKQLVLNLLNRRSYVTKRQTIWHWKEGEKS